MQPVKGLRAKRIGDVAIGNLVALQMNGKSMLALRIESPALQEHATTALVLNDTARRPYVYASNGYCLDFGAAPVFHWEPLKGQFLLPNSSEPSPVAGCLLVTTDQVAIGGEHGSKIDPNSACWDVDNGMLCVTPDIEKCARITHWTMTFRDSEKALLRFPLQRVPKARR